MNTDLERAREYFAGDLFATKCAGVVIEEVRPGYAKCTMEITPDVCNARGTPMGGAIFTLADLASAASMNYADDAVVVTQTANITYLSAAKGTRLIAEAREVRRGGSTAFGTVEIKDDLGRQVAMVTVSGFVLKK